MENTLVLIFIKFELYQIIEISMECITVIFELPELLSTLSILFFFYLEERNINT